MDFPQIVGVKDNTFDPMQPGSGRRARRRGIIAVVTVVVLSLLSFGVIEVAPHRCRLPNLDFKLSKVDGECVGVTNESAYAFTPELANITSRIAAENRHVRDAWDKRGKNGPSVPYVKVALLMPMTSGPTAAMTDISVVLHSLQGAFTAQYRANRELAQAYGTPQIQLLLANEGRNQDQWKPVVRQLEGLTGGGHPLVAVVGMGISIKETAAAAKELSDKRIAAFGAVLSATDITRPGVSLYKISPSNLQYAHALEHYLSQHPALRTGRGFLVYDNRADDNYVRTLREAFVSTFSQYGLDLKKSSFTGSTGTRIGTPADFSDALIKICLNKSTLVFYAGRDRDLARLVKTLNARAETCDPKPITILTGATGITLQSDSDLQAQMKDKKVTLVDASTTDVTSWQQGISRPPEYANFYKVFHKDLSFGDGALTDGYAIMHHDAVIAALSAIRAASSKKTDDVFNAVPHLSGDRAVKGAGGIFSFNDTSTGWPDRDVPVIVTPAQRTTTP